MKKNLVGLRVITNLHCNNNCTFCYQKDKSKKILPLDDLLAALSMREHYNCEYKSYDYCTIMGGESTLLPNLNEYIKIGSLYAKQTRLTTNGKLLTNESIAQYKAAGLDGINISISTLNEVLYKKIHGTDLDISELYNVIYDNQKNIDFRINIPLCKENCEDDYHRLADVIEYFVATLGLNVTMCEDIKGTFSLFDNFDKIGAKVVEETNYGLIFLELYGKRIGYYTHRNSSYNDTDLVVTPLGTFINWDDYCKEVGMNQ